MDEDKKARLKTATQMIRELRRSYSRDFLAKIESKNEGDSLALEDEMRLIGTLEAAYNHCLASIASDGDIYCLTKHLSYAIILCGELEQPDVEPLYDILAIITDGRVEACAACKQEERSNNGSTNRNVNDSEAEAVSSSGGAVGDSVSDN